jgi:D-alanine-D-alanine ligase
MAQMIIQTPHTDLPVLLLHNIDHNWPLEEQSDCMGWAKLLTAAMCEVGHPVTRITLEDTNLSTLLSGYDPNEWVVFNWCEEIPGVPRSCWMGAQELERQGFTYTGADYASLLLSQDKRQVKKRLKDSGIPTARWQIFESASAVDWDLFPAIVKPAFEHYSLGIERESVVQSQVDLIRRVGYVNEKHHQPALVEEFIDGREFHVGMIGNHTPQMLPPAEIDFSAFNDIHDRLCTYEANFDRSSLAYRSITTRLPIELTTEELSSIEQAVLGTYRATDCRDFARMDMRLKDGVFYILDVNPNADISPETSLIKAAEMVGYSYGQFGSLLVNLAAQRHPVFGRLSY